jgi:hypothetical protein
MKLTPQGVSRNLREDRNNAAHRAMAAKRNITVAIELALLKRARAIAAQRGLSVSALLAGELRALVEDEASYESARRRATALLDEGFALGGARITDRASLHERTHVR